MRKRTRTLLFTFLLSFFLFGAPTLFFYSQGYRIDFDEQRLTQVGAFYFNVEPARVEVFVDDQFLGHTTRFFGTVLTRDFLPGTYTVRIEREGYHSWEKRLEVLPTRVTEAKNIVLFPKDAMFVPVEEQVQGFWLSPNMQESLVQKYEDADWVLYFWDIESNEKYPVLSGLQTQDNIENITWTLDENSFTATIRSNGVEEQTTRQINRALFGTENVQQESLPIPDLLPNEDSVLIEPENAVARLETETGIVWLDQQGMVHYQQFSLQDIQIINTQAFQLEKNASYQIHQINKEWFLQENSKLYRLNITTQEFELFFDSLGEFKIDPDNTKLVLSNQNEIWIHYLKEQQGQPARKKDERIFLTRFGEPIANVEWLTPNYLVFTLQDKVTIAEIDTRDRINTIELASFTKPQLFWLPATQKLLVYSADQIFLSGKLLP